MGSEMCIRDSCTGAPRARGSPHEHATCTHARAHRRTTFASEDNVRGRYARSVPGPGLSRLVVACSLGRWWQTRVARPLCALCFCRLSDRLALLRSPLGPVFHCAARAYVWLYRNSRYEKTILPPYGKRLVMRQTVEGRARTSNLRSPSDSASKTESRAVWTVYRTGVMVVCVTKNFVTEPLQV